MCTHVDKVGVFIDGANLAASARSLGFDVDFQKLRKYLSNFGRIIRAYYFTGVHDSGDYDPNHGLHTWLAYNGYTMITKPTKTFTNADGKTVVKGNMDVELTVHMMEVADKLDHIILFSGDGDFRLLVEAVQRRGAKVTVVSTLKTARPYVADELRRQADAYIDLGDEEIRTALMRTSRHLLQDQADAEQDTKETNPV